jgi:hypothetical protein
MPGRGRSVHVGVGLADDRVVVADSADVVGRPIEVPTDRRSFGGVGIRASWASTPRSGRSPAPASGGDDVWSAGAVGVRIVAARSGRAAVSTVGWKGDA